MNRHLVALVIGNAAYTGAGPLKNPTNDAEDIAARLSACGFSVIRETDCTFQGMDRAMKKFKRALDDNEVGLFFFAGHGMQIDGENYLAAVDTDVSGEIEAKHSSLPLNRVIGTMERTATSTNIIILDACRDNPYERAWHRSSATRGMAPVFAPKGTLIAFATSPGQVAKDGVGRNGAYTAALLQHIDTPDCSLESMFKRVRNTLSAATKQKQISWEHTSLSGEFFFNLSLGARIDDYSATALSDGLLILDESRASHRLIQELKSSTWPRQNPAVDSLTAATANKYSANSLFVIGRNIYQAACGGSRSAASYLRKFVTRTQGMDVSKRKALLDGMLFEVFFDPKAQLRAKPKGWCFSEVFHLQQHSELSESFEFVAECLVSHADRFHAIPGKNHIVPVDIVTSQKSPNIYVVEGVFLGGVDILWMEEDDFADDADKSPRHRSLSLVEFEEQLSGEMVIPPDLLKVTYPFQKSAKNKLLFPLGWTTRKR
jgi:Caspase domain